MVHSQPIGFLGTFGAGLLAVSMTRSVEMAVLIRVSSTMWRAGAPIMKSNGKSRINHVLVQVLSKVALKVESLDVSTCIS
jgi:hypothetical protein